MLDKLKVDLGRWIEGWTDNYFVVDDFKLTSEWDASFKVERIEIRYRYSDADGVFCASIPTTRDDNGELSIAFSCSPGEIGPSERGKANGVRAFQERVTTWLGWLRADLQARPAARLAAQAVDAVEDLAKKVGDIEDRMFTAEEANELRRRLDELEAKLVAQVKESSSLKEEVAEKIKEVHRHVEVLKQQVDTLTKPSWLRSLLSRMKKVAADPDNQKILNAATEIGVKLLSDGSKPHS